MTKQHDNRRANATAVTGAGIAAAGGVMREKAVARAHEAHYDAPPWKRKKNTPRRGDKRQIFPGRRLIDMPGPAAARTKARTLYLGGTAVGGVGATALGHGLLSRNKEPLKKRDSLVHEGLYGTQEALRARKKEMSRKDVPKKKRAAQAGAVAGASIGGGKIASLITERTLPGSTNVRRAALNAIGGAATGVATIPVSRSVLGFETKNGSTKRPKRKLKSPSSSARVIEGRHGASRSQFRSSVVPSDVRKLDTNYHGYNMDRKKKRAIVMGAGAVPIAGAFTSGAAAASMAPPEQRRRAGLQQTGADLAGGAAGVYGGAKAGQFAVGRIGALQKPADKAAAGITNMQNRARKVVGLGAKAGGKGRVAGGIVGGLLGGAVGSQTAGFASYNNILRRERKRNSKIHKKAMVAPQMTEKEQRKQLSRKKRNNAINAWTSGLGLGGAATFAASLKTKRPARKKSLEHTSLGLGLTGGGIAGINGLNGYRITRRDLKAQEKALSKADVEFLAKREWVQKTAKKKKALHPSQNLGTKPGQWRVVGHRGGGVLYEQIPLDYERRQRRKARAAGVEKAYGMPTIPKPRIGVPQFAPSFGTRRPVGATRKPSMRRAGNVMRRNSSGIMRVTSRRAGLG